MSPWCMKNSLWVLYPASSGANFTFGGTKKMKPYCPRGMKVVKLCVRTTLKGESQIASNILLHSRCYKLTYQPACKTRSGHKKNFEFDIGKTPIPECRSADIQLRKLLKFEVDIRILQTRSCTFKQNDSAWENLWWIAKKWDESWGRLACFSPKSSS